MTTTEVAAPEEHRPPPRRKGRRLRLLAVFAVLVAAFAYLLVEGVGSSLDYFDTVHQALASKASLGTTTFRLEGTVVAGSIHRTRFGTDFTVEGGGERVAVVNRGSPPGLFQPTVPVVVVGHFAAGTSSVFMSDQIEVKHSATYVAEHPNRVRGRTGKVVG